jgi:hypothetical protein
MPPSDVGPRATFSGHERTPLVAGLLGVGHAGLEPATSGLSIRPPRTRWPPGSSFQSPNPGVPDVPRSLRGLRISGDFGRFRYRSGLGVRPRDARRGGTAVPRPVPEPHLWGPLRPPAAALATPRRDATGRERRGGGGGALGTAGPRYPSTSPASAPAAPVAWRRPATQRPPAGAAGPPRRDGDPRPGGRPAATLRPHEPSHRGPRSAARASPFCQSTPGNRARVDGLGA